jgi:hypothetical protein
MPAPPELDPAAPHARPPHTRPDHSFLFSTLMSRHEPHESFHSCSPPPSIRQLSRSRLAWPGLASCLNRTAATQQATTPAHPSASLSLSLTHTHFASTSTSHPSITIH